MTEGEAPEADSPEGERGPSGARMVARVRSAEARAERAERELERTKRSASYVVGNLLVKAAKDPRRLLTLPRDLWRVWRLRKARRTAPRPPMTTRPRDAIDLDANRLLVPRIATVPAGRGMSIAGALGWATARAWSPYAAVSAALPHEAAALVEVIDPDIVVIDTSASLPGQAWSHLGDPAAPDRLLAAGALVDAAHALGRPAILLRMTPPSHTAFLDGLARRCDLVVDGPGSDRRSPWHPGIDPADRPDLPAVDGLLIAPDAPVADRRVRAAADAAVRLVHHDPALPAATAWARALAQASGLMSAPVPARLLGAALDSVAALAAGRRVLAPGDDDLVELLHARPRAAHAVIASSDPAMIAASAGSGPVPLSNDEHRAALAAILLAAAAPVQLTGLAERLRIDARPRACWDVAVLADGDLDPDRLLAQSWLPREVVYDVPIGDRARDRLAEGGVRVLTVDGEGARDAALLGLQSPLLAIQVDLADPHDLLDLVAGHVLGLPTPSHPTDARLVAVL